MNKISNLHPATIIATWFWVGKIKFAPGTWGSLATFPLFILCHYLLILANNQQQFEYIFLGVISFLYIIGTWATKIYMDKTGKHDPKEVVIDEVVGQLIVFFAAFVLIMDIFGIYDLVYKEGNQITASYITQIFTTKPFILIYSTLGMGIYFLCFVLFRIFDIFKPWPINWCDKNINNATGVMFDDILASLYAAISFYLLAMLYISIIK